MRWQLSKIENLAVMSTPERIALLAMYHDASEVLTGNLPTPVKYFNSQIAQEYKAIEKIAQRKLVDMVPEGCGISLRR
ncbi:YfbR-like 5'-deoxynucleotidase [Escherichia coli]